MRPAERFYTRQFFPLRIWNQIEPQAVQAQLRAAFEEWGRPSCIRFDNGKPWGNPGMVVPTALTLWLVGLGIQPIFGRLHHSTDNAVVERCHGVLAAWVEPQTCADLDDLQQRLSSYAHLQREVYPGNKKASRLGRFPALRLKRHPYRSEQEEQLWSVKRVLDYVAAYTFARKVEKNGRITLMTHEYALGRQYRAQSVAARLDPLSQQWLIRDRFGEVIGRFPAHQFTYLTIAGLTMTHKHFKAKHVGAFHRV